MFFALIATNLVLYLSCLGNFYEGYYQKGCILGGIGFVVTLILILLYTRQDSLPEDLAKRIPDCRNGLDCGDADTLYSDCCDIRYY